MGSKIKLSTEKSKEAPSTHLKIIDNLIKKSRSVVRACMLANLFIYGTSGQYPTPPGLTVPSITVRTQMQGSEMHTSTYTTTDFLRPVGESTFHTVNWSETIVSQDSTRNALSVRLFETTYRRFDTTNPDVHRMFGNNRYFYLPLQYGTGGEYVNDVDGNDWIVLRSNPLSIDKVLMQERLHHELLHDAWYNILSPELKTSFLDLIYPLLEVSPERSKDGKSLVVSYFQKHMDDAQTEVPGLPDQIDSGDPTWHPLVKRKFELVFTPLVREFISQYQFAAGMDRSIYNQFVHRLLLWYSHFRTLMELDYETHHKKAANRNGFIYIESYPLLVCMGANIFPLRRFYQGIVAPNDLPSEASTRSNPYMASEEAFRTRGIPVIRDFLKYLSDNRSRLGIE